MLTYMYVDTRFNPEIHFGYTKAHFLPTNIFG